MKKILVVAALLAVAAIPATPAFAAGMAAPEKPAASCFLMPFAPDCVAEWKMVHDDMMMKASEAPKMAMMTPPPMVAEPMMAKPMMPMMMPNCTKAPAGSGHMFDCK